MRGVVTLGYAMKLGYRALRFSANVAIEDIMQDEGKPGSVANSPAIAPEKASQSKSREKAAAISGWLATANILLSLAFFIFMYKYLPLVAATELKKLDPAFGGQIVFNLIDGAVRLVLFLLFIWGVSLWKDIRRVYEYHGAEHKTVFAWEAGDDLTVANARRHPRQHPRCGTSFLMVVMLVSIGLFSAVKFDSLTLNLLTRIAMIPLIAGVSYEIIRAAGKKESGAIFKLMTLPGIWLQNLTTREPSDDQLEVAIYALKESLKLEPVVSG
jgi:uncharacterized protein YqhQ